MINNVMSRKYIKDKISVVIPIYNESKNISILINNIINELKNKNYEVIIVDDESDDGSIEEVLKISQKNEGIKVIQKMNDKGLTQSIKFGLQTITGDIFIVMDGDGQHDPKDISKMFNVIKKNDLVIGYRDLTKIRSIGQFRKKMSIFFNKFVNLLLGTNLIDPLTGFFMGKTKILKKNFFDLSNDGFKVLIDLIHVNKNKIKISEIEINFKKREFGKSKLDSRVAFSFFTQLLSLSTFGIFSSKFIGFIMIGSVGLLVHLSVFFLLYSFELSFLVSFFISTFIATINNFFLNHYFNFYIYTRISSLKLIIIALPKYFLITLPGSISSISSANFIHSEYNTTIIFPALIGIIIDITFKYYLSKKWVWKN